MPADRVSTYQLIRRDLRQLAGLRRDTLLCGVLHLRVIAPQERSEDVIALLMAEVGVAHLVVHRGAALEHQGDEITADIARECANELVESLKEFGLQTSGAITLDVVDTVLSTAAHRAEEDRTRPRRRHRLGRTRRPHP